MERYGLSDKEWPLARVRWPRGRPDHEEVERYLAFLDSLLDRGEIFALVTDLRDGAMLKARERMWLMQEMKGREERAGAVCAASAAVTGSVLMLAVLRISHLVAPPTYPFRVFLKMGDAEAWVQEMLARRLAGRPPYSEHPPSL